MRFVSRRRPLAILAIVAAGCTASSERVLSSEDALVSSSPQPFDVAVLTPRAKASFQAASGVTELCIVPGRFVGEGYTDADGKDEEALCRIDWNAAPEQGGVVAAGLAPAVTETAPVTDIQRVTSAAVRDAVESLDQANALPRPTATLARLRTSLDAARFGAAVYAPSILGYYGTSRMLGHIAEVAPAVWRTLDVTRHQRVADNGARLTLEAAQPLRALWETFAATDGQPASRDRVTYTTDRAQLYGAFSPVRPGVVVDRDVDTAVALARSERVRNLVDPRPVSDLVGRGQAAVAPVVSMQGIVEMLVLDAILLDGDRFRGNRVHGVPATVDGVPVSRLVLTDTGGGLLQASPAAIRGGAGFDLLGRVAHIAPDLYTHVQRLRRMVDNPELGTFVQSEWRFTERDWLRYREMAIAVATLIHDRCAAGALRLDLDVTAAQNGAPPPASCDLP